MKDKLVTLLGGGGFVGRYVAQALMKAGARVRIAQRDPRQAYFLRSQGGLGQTQFAGADMTRPDSIRRAVEGADMVVNLVGSFTGNLQALHVQGARVAAEAARATGAQSFVQISALGADPNSPAVYARTKAEGEAAVRAAFPSATILRPSTIFGREDQFTNRFARMIMRLPVVPVLSPASRFQPVYVADVAQAVRAALADAETHGGNLYELGGPDVLTMAELNRWLAAAIGREGRFVELPDVVGSLIAGLPLAPISRDQWALLQRGSVATPGAAGLEALGITPTPMASVAPAWLVQYRRLGRFGTHAKLA